MRKALQFGLVMAVALFAVTGVRAFDSERWDAENAKMLAMAMDLKAAYSNYSQRVISPAQDVTIPLETYPDGSIKSVVNAKRAQFFQGSGRVWAETVVVEQFKKGGELDFHVEAQSCLVDGRQKCCWLQGHTKATHRKTTLEGDDAFYCSSNKFLKVFSNAQVVSEDVKMKGMQL